MEITVEQYRKAIKNALSENLFNVLKTLMNLRDMETTVVQLAAALQTNVQAAHSKIGYIGKTLADYLGIATGTDSEGNSSLPSHFQIIGDYVNKNGEGNEYIPAWKMNENLRKALKKLKTDERGIDELAAFKIWKILTGAARNDRKISRLEIAEKAKAGYGVVDLALIRIDEYCRKKKMPPLAMLAVNQSGSPAKGYADRNTEKLKEMFNKVFEFDWDLHKNPFDSEKKIFTEVEIIKTLVANPGRAKEMFAKVKVRGKAQPLFRKALMEVYDSKCALCGFSVEHALEASHIVAWSVSKSDEKLDVRNGLLLCATHHKLFDSHFIRINNDFSISVNFGARTARKYSDCDRVMIENLCNRKIILPRKKEHWPRIEYIEKRNNLRRDKELSR